MLQAPVQTLAPTKSKRSLSDRITTTSAVLLAKCTLLLAVGPVLALVQVVASVFTSRTWEQLAVSDDG